MAAPSAINSVSSTSHMGVRTVVTAWRREWRLLGMAHGMLPDLLLTGPHTVERRAERTD